MNTITKRKDINYDVITIAQIIMAIVVVEVHTDPFNNMTGIVKSIIETFNLLAVPFFFFVSAWFFSKKYFQMKDDDNKLVLLKQSCIKYIKLYLIWNIIYLPITIYGIIKYYPKYGMLKSICFYVYRLFIKGEQFYSWPLWYLLSLAYAFFFLYFTKKYLKKEKYFYIIGMIAFIISFFIKSGIFNGEILNKLIEVFSDRPFKGLFYIVFGMCLFNNREFLFNKLKLLVQLLVFNFLFLVCLYFEQSAFGYVIRPICAMSLFVLIFNMAYRLNFTISKKLSLRLLSVIIYYTHMIFFFIYGVATSSLEDSGQLKGFFFTLISCISIYILFIILKNITFNRKKTIEFNKIK